MRIKALLAVGVSALLVTIASLVAPGVAGGTQLPGSLSIAGYTAVHRSENLPISTLHAQFVVPTVTCPPSGITEVFLDAEILTSASSAGAQLVEGCSSGVPSYQAVALGGYAATLVVEPGDTLVFRAVVDPTSGTDNVKGVVQDLTSGTSATSPDILEQHVTVESVFVGIVSPSGGSGELADFGKIEWQKITFDHGSLGALVARRGIDLDK
jgi:hypothetical protein